MQPASEISTHLPRILIKLNIDKSVADFKTGFSPASRQHWSMAPPHDLITPPIIVPRQVTQWSQWSSSRLSIWLGLLLTAAIFAILFWFNPETHGFYPRCALYSNTGLYCPGCGSLRALHLLTHGRVLAALHYNILLVCLLPVALFHAVRFCRAVLSGQPFRHPHWPPRIVTAFIVVVVVFTILRNIPAAPFLWLAPPG